MEIPTIEMDQDEAAERLAAYRKHLEGRYSRAIAEEYEAAVAGYEALAAGIPMINLQEAILSGGLDAKGRPNLAVARADRKHVGFSRGWRSSRGWFSTLRRSRWNYEGDLRIQVDFPEIGPDSAVDGYAIVPMSPPEALDAIGGASCLAKHLILWEVEEWADRPLQVLPDRDPLLLRRIVGDLFAVMAQWDLTELERQVMTGRRDA